MTTINGKADVSAGNATSCAQALKILADETRLSVVRQLLRRPKSVGEINACLAVSQSLLSHHLRILRDAGLVEAERVGKSMRYRLADAFRESRSGSGVDLGCCRLVFDLSNCNNEEDQNP